MKNNREYESISKEIEYQDLEQQVAAKKIRENEALISEKKAVIDEAQEALAHREADLVEKKKELDTIIEETAKEEEALLKERENLVGQIDERMMVAYTKVRANAHNKLAVDDAVYLHSYSRLISKPTVRKKPSPTYLQNVPEVPSCVSLNSL